MYIAYALLSLIFLILLPIGLIRPSVIAKLIKLKLNRPQIAFVCIGGFLLFATLGAYSPSFNESTEKGKAKEHETSPILTTTPANPKYERLNYENAKTVENISYLYTGSDKSKEAIEKIAREIKSKDCSKPCNISLFDDKKAAELDIKYKKITTPEEAEIWKKQNYVYVADHFPGYLEFEDDGIFFYYMYKDWYYDELKTK